MAQLRELQLVVARNIRLREVLGDERHVHEIANDVEHEHGLDADHVGRVINSIRRQNTRLGAMAIRSAKGHANDNQAG
jgi:hypothetical protein